MRQGAEINLHPAFFYDIYKDAKPINLQGLSDKFQTDLGNFMSRKRHLLSSVKSKI
jgi:hypothetical protein